MSASKEKLFELAMSRLDHDKVSDKLGQVMVGVLASDAAGNLTGHFNSTTREQVTTLKDLKELGYDQDSDVARNVNTAAAKMHSILGKIGDSVAKAVDV